MNITFEYIKNKLTYEDKVNIIKDWDEYNETLSIPQRSLRYVEDLKVLLYPKNPDELNSVFWFKELYVGVCRDFADQLMVRVNFNIDYFHTLLDVS
jgi:hypothetical protein